MSIFTLLYFIETRERIYEQDPVNAAPSQHVHTTKAQLIPDTEHNLDGMVPANCLFIM